MGIENEIVRFIARIDLDPQDARAFQDGLQAAEKASSALRASLTQTSEQMQVLRARGEEGTREYARLEKQMKQLTSQLKDSENSASRYSKALGLNQMSLKELREHSRSLKSALENMHREADPELWKKYSKELQNTYRRIDELQNSSRSCGRACELSFSKLVPTLTAAGVATSIVRGGVAALRDGFKAAAEASQILGDRVALDMAAMSAGLSEFLRQITTTKEFSLRSIAEVAQAAREAQAIRDEQFERQNSYQIEEIRRRREILDLEAQANDRTLSADKRLAALDLAIEKEKSLADMRRSMAEAEQEAALKELRAVTHLDDEQIRSVIDRYELNQENIKQGKEYNDLLSQRQQLESMISQYVDGSYNDPEIVGRWAAQIAKLDSQMSAFPDAIKNTAQALRQYDWANDALVIPYVESRKKIEQAETDKSAAEESASRKRSQLREKMNTEALEAIDRQLEREKNSLKKGLLERQVTEEEYNRRVYELETAALERKSRISIKKSEQYAGQLLDRKLALQNMENQALDKQERERQNALRRQLLAGELTQEEYSEKSAAVTMETLEARKALLEKYGKDVSQIESQIINEQMGAQSRALGVIRTTAARQALELKRQLYQGLISREEYDSRVRQLDIASLEAERAVRKQYGEDLTDIDRQIFDRRQELQARYIDLLNSSRKDIARTLSEAGVEMSQAIRQYLTTIKEQVTENDLELAAQDVDRLKRLIDSALNDSVSKAAQMQANARGFDKEMEDLEKMHDLQLVSEEEFQARKQEIIREYASANAEIQTQAWRNAVDIASDFLDRLGSISSSLQSMETANLEAEKNRQLAAAGDNAEKRTAIEEDFERRKLELQKKYADIDMGINIAKAIAAGALASMMAWVASGANPIMYAIIQAMIAASTAVEVATIIAQRNAIKNQTVQTSAASSVKSSNAVGFSDGGYTGRGGRMEVAGVVHRGEYVVPQPEMHDPQVAAMVASIESRRRARTSRNALPGFAEGGYTGDAGQNADGSSSVLTSIYGLLQQMASQPAQAYVVLSQFEAQQMRQDNFRKLTSLRSNQ